MSNNVKRWGVVAWADKPQKTEEIPLCCPNCASDAILEIGETPGATIIAAIGLGIIFDPAGYTPPKNFLPDEIQCRTCRKIFSAFEAVA
jgi:hypothetical protein